VNNENQGEVAKIDSKLNQIHVHKIAIDIPSGVLADGNIPKMQSFSKQMKLCLYSSANNHFCIQKSANIVVKFTF
jgi:NAD(P)H-hydrate repair Nnr-like enzyme with NAD(P)H-hydrate epimerase domain